MTAISNITVTVVEVLKNSTATPERLFPATLEITLVDTQESEDPGE